MTLHPAVSAACTRAGWGARAGVRWLRSWPSRTLARIVLAVIVGIALLVGPPAERLGDRYQAALPLLGLGCAIATGSGAEYSVRYAVMWAGIRTGKNTLGRRHIAVRPNGGDGGMPSGHTASASFGAAGMVRSCLAGSPVGQAAAIVAAGFTGASRIQARAHTIWQVLAGVLWALLCDMALRANSPARARVVRGLRAVGRRLGFAGRAAADNVQVSRAGQGAMRQQPVSIREGAPEPSNSSVADRP